MVVVAVVVERGGSCYQWRASIAVSSLLSSAFLCGRNLIGKQHFSPLHSTDGEAKRQHRKNPKTDEEVPQKTGCPFGWAIEKDDGVHLFLPVPCRIEATMHTITLDPKVKLPDGFDEPATLHLEKCSVSVKGDLNVPQITKIQTAGAIGECSHVLIPWLAAAVPQSVDCETSLLDPM